MSKAKFAPEIKIHACEDFLSGKYTSAQICEKYGITYNEKNRSSTSLSEWMAKYRAVGQRLLAIPTITKVTPQS